MQIRDVIHGTIALDSDELLIVESKYFQRLRQIRQLGFAENPFPSATHNRFVHSLGAMETASRVFDRIFLNAEKQNLLKLSPKAFARFRSTVRLAALLHDVGHGPLSHTTEFAMPLVKDLKLPTQLLEPHQESNVSRRATHEDYTLKLILDSGLTDLLRQAGQKSGVQPEYIAGLIEPNLRIDASYFQEGGVDFRPILTQIISSELDADRMDYLRRDSLYAGVSYGQFDFDWLLGSLTLYSSNQKCYLAIEHRALYAFEDFLISRFHMFLMVYFHHKSIVYEAMLNKYLTSPDCDYVLPTDIEQYCEFNDAHLNTHLSQSSNLWARRIADKDPFQVLIELHSGIPATETAQLEQEKLLVELKDYLDQEKIESLTMTSVSSLSKYFGRPGPPIFVRYDNHFSPPEFIPLEQCTDLFHRYRDQRSITRVYVADEDLSRCANLRQFGSLKNKTVS